MHRVLGLFDTENTMPDLPTLSHRLAQLATITIGMSVVWLSTSCHATDHHVTKPPAFDPSTKSPPSRFASSEVLVKFKSGVSPERIALILRDNRTDVITELQQGRVYRVRIGDDRSVESAITQLTSYREVEYAEPNYLYETQK
jgi:hypothetical protein